MAAAERQILIHALGRSGGSVPRAAKDLGLTEREFRRRARAHKVLAGRRHRTLPEEVTELERTWILQALASTRGNVKEAAELLNVDRGWMYRRLHQFDVNGPRYGSRAPRCRRVRRDLPAAVHRLKAVRLRSAFEVTGEVKQTALLLGIERGTAHRWMKRYGVKR
jgi:DNA-binding NtrC family response regulator